MTQTEPTDTTQWDEDDEEEIPYGQPGSWDNPDGHVKWIADGATTLTEAAERLRGYAEHLDGLAQRGWVLSQPVDNSHLFLHWGGQGPPPQQDRPQVTPG